MVPVVVEVDLNQRKGGDGLLVLRKAMRELLMMAIKRELPFHLANIRTAGTMLSAIVDVPGEVAVELLKNSGSVRGAFVRPLLGGSFQRPAPLGFGNGAHKVLWVKVERYSDLVFAQLKGLKVEGLVCGRHKGEVGVRVRSTENISEVHASVCSALGESGKVKKVYSNRHRYRLRNVPLCMQVEVEKIFALISNGAKVISANTIGGGRYEAVMEATVEGLPEDRESWTLSGLGIRPVVVKRLPRGRSGKQPAPVVVQKGDKVAAPKGLSSVERVTYASALRGRVQGDVEMADSSQQSVGSRQQRESDDAPPPRSRTSTSQKGKQVDAQRSQQQPVRSTSVPKAAPKKVNHMENLVGEIQRLNQTLAKLMAEMEILRRENMELKQALQTKQTRGQKRQAEDDQVESEMGGGGDNTNV